MNDKLYRKVYSQVSVPSKDYICLNHKEKLAYKS